jgi:hypothetical protein
MEYSMQILEKHWIITNYFFLFLLKLILAPLNFIYFSILNLFNIINKQVIIHHQNQYLQFHYLAFLDFHHLAQSLFLLDLLSLSFRYHLNHFLHSLLALHNHLLFLLCIQICSNNLKSKIFVKY